MGESDNNGDKKLTLSGRGTLQLKRTVETGRVRQSFSHGRSKQVLVEHKRKRVAPASKVASEPATEEVVRQAAPVRPETAPDTGDDSGALRPRIVLKTLTDDERASRAKALKGAVNAAKLARERAVEEARKRSAEETRIANERAVAEKRRLEEEDRKKGEEEARQKAEEEAARRLAEEASRGAAPPATGTAATRRPVADSLERRKPRRGGREDSARPPVRRSSQPRRRGGKMTITQALGGDQERQRSLAAMRRARERERRAQNGGAEAPKKVYREVIIPDVITVQELASRMTERSTDVIRSLMKMGVMATINDTIDTDTAELIVEEFGHSPKRVSEADVEQGMIGTDDSEDSLVPRPPVVTVMGHVDHGKTSLLDALRHTNVVSGEAGGITQHIGAYQVVLDDGRKITFIDTPGHAAFTAMRARGARVTDIVVLVVAADDGIMPQTIEAINHARAAEVPIIVAINKMDKPGANADRVRQELLQHDVVVEGMGGEVLDVEISALKGTNLDKLREAILLQAELLETRANPERPAEGIVIEAQIEKGRGAVATLLVQRGTIKVGDIVVAGSEWGRARALLNEQGAPLKSAGPSQPVAVLGLGGAPIAGDLFAVVENEARAREVSEFRQRRHKQQSAVGRAPTTLETMFSTLGEARADELAVVVKGDTQGSIEAINGALEKLGTDEVAVRIVHSAIGGINESDISLAESTGAIIIGFNVRATRQATTQAEASGVEIRYYAVIYDLVDEIKAGLSGMLAPEMRETALGSAEVREVFGVSKVGKIAGCLVVDGAVRRGARARLLRDNVVVHEGEVGSLRRFKDEVREVAAGTECGIGLDKFQDIKVGDIIDVYEVEEVARTL